MSASLENNLSVHRYTEPGFELKISDTDRCPISMEFVKDIDKNYRLVVDSHVYNVTSLYTYLSGHNMDPVSKKPFTDNQLKQISTAYKMATGDVTAQDLSVSAKHTPDLSVSAKHTPDLKIPEENLDNVNIEALQQQSISQLSGLLNMKSKNVKKLCPDCMQLLFLHLGEIKTQQYTLPKPIPFTEKRPRLHEFSYEDIPEYQKPSVSSLYPHQDKPLSSRQTSLLDYVKPSYQQSTQFYHPDYDPSAEKDRESEYYSNYSHSPKFEKYEDVLGVIDESSVKKSTNSQSREGGPDVPDNSDDDIPDVPDNWDDDVPDWR